MVILKWTPKAINDIKNIADFISKDSFHYATLTVRSIRYKARLLRNHPKIGKTVPELNREDIRELLQGNFRIIYWIENEKTIHIITIHHSSRLFSSKNLFI